MRLLLPFLLVASLCFGQHQERKVLLYNLGFGGITSAVGAVLNKPKGKNWKPYFFRGLWQGSFEKLKPAGGTSLTNDDFCSCIN